MYPPGKETRLIVDDELVRLFRHLEHQEAEGLENYVIPLVIRLQSVPVYVELTGTGKTVYEGSFTVPGNYHSLAKVEW